MEIVDTAINEKSFLKTNENEPLRKKNTIFPFEESLPSLVRIGIERKNLLTLDILNYYNFYGETRKFCTDKLEKMEKKKTDDMSLAKRGTTLKANKKREIENKKSLHINDISKSSKKFVRKLHQKTVDFIQTPFLILIPVKKESKSEIRAMALSPDHSKLATGLLSGELVVFEIGYSEDPIMKFHLTDENKKNCSIYDISYSPCGNKLLAGCAKGIVKLFHLQKGEIGKLIIIGKQAVRTVNFSPDGESIIVGSDDGYLRYFKDFNKELYTDEGIDIINHPEGVCAFAFSSAVQLCASGGNDKILNIFSLGNDFKAVNIKKIDSHNGIVRSVTFSNDGAFVLTGSYDKTAKIFDSSTGKNLMTYKGHTEPIYSAALSPNSLFVITGSDDKSAKLFDRKTGETLANFVDKNEEYSIRSVLFLGSGSILATAGKEGVVKFFSIRNGTYSRGHSRHGLSDFSQEHQENIKKDVNSVDITHDGEKLATGGDDGTVRVYEINTGFEIRKFYANEESIYSVKFSPDCRLILAAGEDYFLRIYDIAIGDLVKSFRDHKEYINQILFSPNNREFASGSVDKTIKIYDYFDRKNTHTLPVEPDSSDIMISSMVYTNDGLWIISVGANTGGENSINFYSKEGSKSKIPIEDDEDDDTGLVTIAIIEGKYFAVNTEKRIFICNLIPDLINISEKQFLRVINTQNDLSFLSIALSSNDKLIIMSMKEIEDKANKEEEKDEEEDNNKKSIYYVDYINIHKNDDKFHKVFSTETTNDNEKLIGSSLRYDKTRDLILVGTSIGVPRLFNLKSILTEIKFTSFSNAIELLSSYNLGSRVAALVENGPIRLINVFSGVILSEVERPKIKKINCLKIIDLQDSSIMFLAGESSKIQYRDLNNSFQEFEEYDLMKGIEEPKNVILLEVAFQNNNFYLYAYFDCGLISVFCYNEKKTKLIDIKGMPSKNLKVSPLLLLPYYDLENDIWKIFILYINGLLISFEFNFTSDSIKCKKILNELRENLICGSCYSHDVPMIITGGHDKFVRTYEIRTSKEKIFKGHKEKICAVNFLCDYAYGVSASTDNLIKVFEIDTCTELLTLRTDVKIIDICSSSVLDSIIIGTVNGLRIIDKILNPRNKLKKFITLGNDTDTKKFNDIAPLLKDDCFNMVPLFQGLSVIRVMLSFSNNEVEILKNVVQLLLSSISLEAKALLGDSIFIKDKIFDISPWDIWTAASKQEKNVDNVKLILAKLIEIVTCPNLPGVEKIPNKGAFLGEVAKEFPGHLKGVLDAFWRPGDNLTIKYYRMDKFLYAAYYFDKVVRTLGLRKTAKTKIVFPLLLNCSSHSPCARNLEKVYEDHCSKLYELSEKDQGYINCQLKVSRISLDEILKFDVEMRSFSLSMFDRFQPEDIIFKSELLVVVVDYLWRLDILIGQWFYQKMLLFIGFEFVICLNILYFIPSREVALENSCESNWLTISIAFDVLLLILFSIRVLHKLYKLYHIKSLKLIIDSLYDWGLFDDMIKILGIVTFAVDLDFALNYNEYEDRKRRIVVVKCLLACLFAFSWFRLIEFAKGIQKTAALVRMVFKVTEEMTFYLLIILFVIVWVAFTIFILQETYETSNPWQFLKIIYYLLIGDNEDYKNLDQGLNSELYFILFFFASVLLVIIMLNLLIAIVSNSFNIVLANQKQNEVYEKLQFIQRRFLGLSIEERENLIKNLEGIYLFQLKNEAQLESETYENQTRKTLEILQASIAANINKQNELENKIQQINDKLVATSIAHDAYNAEIEKKLQLILDRLPK